MLFVPRNFHRINSFDLLFLILEFHLHLVRSSGTIYLLPVLPETNYTLDDVIILSKTEENLEVTVTTINSTENKTSFVIGTVGVRLGQQLLSDGMFVENGLILNTSREVEVFIQITGGEYLKVHSTEEFACKFFMFKRIESSRANKHVSIFIYPSDPNTSVTFCPVRFKENKTNHHLEPVRNPIPEAMYCSEVKVYDFKGLALNNISLLSGGMEISSDKPINILELQRNNLSVMVKNVTDENTMERENPSITWTRILPLKDWSNQFTLISSSQRREFHLWLLCMQDSTIDIRKGENQTSLAMKKMSPKSLNVSVDADEAVFLNTTYKCIMQCSLSGAFENQYIPKCSDFLIQTVDFSERLLPKTIRNSDEVIIIYVSKSSYFVPAFQDNTTIYILNINDELILSNGRNYSAYNKLIKLIFCKDVKTGIYRTSAQTIVHNCSFLEDYSNYCQNKILNTTVQRVHDFACLLENTSVNYRQDTENENITISDLNLFNYTKDDLNNNSFLTNISVLEKSSTVITTTYSIPKSTHRDPSSDVNEQFKAVVEVVHYDTELKGILLSGSDSVHSINNPTYVYKTETETIFSEEHDRKSLVAVVISLVSALAAVALLIAGFLLKELISRRQTIRNTRIRPFVSYY